MAKDSVPANQQKNNNVQNQNSNQQPAEETVVEPPDEFLWRCVIENDSEGFAKRLDDEEDEFIAALQEEMKKRNDEGRLPLDVAVILDRSSMVNELITRGVDINAATEKGYTSLHLGAIWGKLASVKTLVDRGADLQLKTSYGERARELAVRYSQMTCVEFLDLAEAKQQLLQSVQLMMATLADPEKVQGRLNREEKKSTDAACKEKLAWIDNTPQATKDDYVNMRTMFEEAVAHIVTKLNEPLPEKPEKK